LEGPVVVQQKDQESLQQRVDEYLRGNSTAYVVEEVREEAVEDIFAMVQKAEEDLKAAQERLERLKWELAKAQEKR
jgi:tRNA(Phe) wybutosine-synthesizing methylase Tyw3